MDVIVNARIHSLPDAVTELPSQGQAYLNLLQSLGYAAEQLPLADLLAQEHGLAGEWLILSPIHWQASHNDAMIMAYGEDLCLADDESRAWFQALADYLARDLWQLFYHNAEIWLMSRKSMPAIQAKSIYQMFHRSMRPELLALDDSLFWSSFLTETQMFLHSHPLNQSRIRQQKPLINGVWVWGTGRLNVSKTAICTLASFENIARLCSTNVHVYSPALSLKPFDTLLINNLTDLSDRHQKELTQSPYTRWFWNDFSYLAKKQRWWQQLWRK